MNPALKLLGFLKNPKIVVGLVLLALILGSAYGVYRHINALTERLVAAELLLNTAEVDIANFKKSVRSKDQTISEIKARLQDLKDVESRMRELNDKKSKELENLRAELKGLKLKELPKGEGSKVITKLFLNEVECLEKATGDGVTQCLRDQQ